MSNSRHGQTPSDTLLPPQLPPLGKFQLLREIGRGAMGVVYEALDPGTGRKLALKVLHQPSALDPREEKHSQDRFLREASLAARIPPHPGIVGLREVGVIDGRRYLGMELAQGLPMSEWRKQASLTVQKQVALLRDVAVAAHHAHEHGVVHRDLKPENILVDPEGRPRITDFGLAKSLTPDGPPSLTGTGMAVGTPYYMSPEQVQGRKDTDRRSDVYSLGVLLYEVLAGRRPFGGESSFEIMTRTVNEPVVPPSRVSRVQINPVHFKSLEKVCLVALAKDRRDRYPTALAFAEDLSRWLRGEAFTVESSGAHRAAHRHRTLRRWGIALGGAGALVALAIVLHLRASQGPGLPPRTFRPGAIAESFSGTNFNALGVRRIDTRPHFENRDHPFWPEGPRYWASFRWTGYLDVPSTGTWIFGTDSKEGIRLLVDGAPVVVNWGYHPPTHDSGMAALDRGPHKLTLEYYHTTEEQLVRLSWKPEGDGPWTPITPATLTHDPVAFVSHEPPGAGESGPVAVPGAQEGVGLTVLESTGDRPIQKAYDTHRQFWRGHWSGISQLWWGSRVKPGDRLRLQFRSSTGGPHALGLALTRASDHGVFRISVNGKEISPALDLYDRGLRTGEVEFKDVELKPGANELEFLILGTHPQAREWGPGSGLYKMALDYVVVR